jgi:hypothetical protein
MIQKRSVVLGILVGLIIVAGGLVLILAKEWLWSLFTLAYGLLGIQAQRTRMWELFTTTIGLGVAAAGLVVVWAVVMRVRNEGGVR